jgi:hypothetical protein
MFLYDFIPQTTGTFAVRLFAYNIHFWNKFVVDETLNVTEILQNEAQIVTGNHAAITRKFMPLVNMRFLVTLPYHTLFRALIMSLKRLV